MAEPRVREPRLLPIIMLVGLAALLVLAPNRYRLLPPVIAYAIVAALPLTRRAKMLLMAQSTISLVTIVIVAARAINVLT